jgi:Tfp pilus assembly protein PilO
MAVRTPKLAGSKRVMIDKANATILVTIGITSFLVVFSLVASRALLGQSSYHSRVITEKQKALEQLQKNNKNADSIVQSYKSFADEQQNILKGSKTGTGPRDGDNPKIILDSLPSKYDFPALISSVEKILKDGGYGIESLGGTDDEIAQLNTATDQPKPIEMPIPIGVTTTYEGAQTLLVTLERSIRPIYISKITYTAVQNKIKLSITANTYYQPEKTLKITSKVVK